MIFTSSPARRVARLIGIGATAVLVTTSFGPGNASAAPMAGGAIDCAPQLLTQTEGGRLVDNWDGIQKDPHNYTEAEKAAMQRDYAARAKAIGYQNLDLEDIREPIEIDVYMHIVREDLTVEGGNIPRTWLRAQMKYFNHSFRGHGHGAEGARTPFKFNLAGVTRTTNQEWFLHAEPGSQNEIDMKTALRDPSSTAETLNVYYSNLVNFGLLGYAYLPEDYDDVGVLDGVVVESQSLPGGSQDPYNLGGTVSHEVGHWAGLLHTFDGGCGAQGDLVEDTPPQASPTSGCPDDEDADTCAGGGLDPIHNYMDYSGDECYNQFTVGQRERMIDQWFVYRDGVE